MLVYLLGFFNLQTKQALDQYGKGMVKFVIHFVFLVCAVTFLVRRGERFYWRTLGWFAAGLLANAVYGVLQLLAARAGHNLDSVVLSPLTGGASSINIYGAVERRVRLPAERAHRRPEPPRDHALRPAARPHAGLPAPRARASPALAARAHARVPAARARSRRSRAAVRSACSSACSSSRFPTGASSGRGRCSPRSPPSRSCSRTSSTRDGTSSRSSSRRGCRPAGSRTSAHFSVYSFIPHVLHTHPLLGLGLNTFSVYYEFVTGKTNWGPHSY